jgi:hypothetical protein
VPRRATAGIQAVGLRTIGDLFGTLFK